jgi:ABC-type Fe3+/spermidine/putrescine transport system ATPase subunit
MTKLRRSACPIEWQEGTPRQIYLEPENHFVANFVGKVNLIEASVAGRAPRGDGCLLKSKVGDLIGGDPESFNPGDRVVAVLRPEAIILEKFSENSANSVHPAVSGRVESCFFYGDHIECQVSVGNETINVRSNAYTAIDVGDRVALVIPRDRIVLFRAGEGKQQIGDESQFGSLTANRTINNLEKGA